MTVMRIIIFCSLLGIVQFMVIVRQIKFECVYFAITLNWNEKEVKFEPFGNMLTIIDWKHLKCWAHVCSKVVGTYHRDMHAYICTD